MSCKSEVHIILIKVFKEQMCQCLESQRQIQSIKALRGEPVSVYGGARVYINYMKYSLVLPDVIPVVPLDVNNNVHPSLVILSPAIKLESQCQKG